MAHILHSKTQWEQAPQAIPQKLESDHKEYMQGGKTRKYCAQHKKSSADWLQRKRKQVVGYLPWKAYRKKWKLF